MPNQNPEKPEKKDRKISKYWQWPVLTVFLINLIFLIHFGFSPENFPSLLKIDGAVVVAAVFFLTSFTKVEKDKYLVINWRIPFLPTPAEGHFIAHGFQQGIRPETYTAGLQLIPFVKIFGELIQKPLVEVPSGKFSLITAKDGQPLKPGQLVAERAVECNNFADGAAFLRRGGQRGIQIPILSPGRYPINEFLFDFKPIEPTVIRKKEIEKTVNGEKMREVVPFIGLITLNIGAEIPEAEGRTLARRVESHNNFQNIAPFIGDQLLKIKDPVERLKNTLEKGIQPDVLEPGAYPLNPEVVEVDEAAVPFIPAGKVGVVISNIGKFPDPTDSASVEIPSVPGLPSGSGYVLKAGIENMRGIMHLTLKPGFVSYKYAHPIAYKLVLVDTTPITLDWATKEEFKEHDHINGVRFQPIEVVTSEGFTVPTKAELVIVVPAQQTPKVVAITGTAEALIADIVAPFFDDVAKRVVSEKTLDDLIRKREEIRRVIERAVREALDEYPVKIVSFRIRKFDFEKSPDENVRQYVGVLAEQATVSRRAELATKELELQEARIELEKRRAEADGQPTLVRARFQKRAARAQQETIRMRAQAVKDLGPVQALVSDPDALAGVVNGLAELAKTLTKKTGAS